MPTTHQERCMTAIHVTQGYMHETSLNICSTAQYVQTNIYSRLSFKCSERRLPVQSSLTCFFLQMAWVRVDPGWMLEDRHQPSVVPTHQTTSGTNFPPCTRKPFQTNSKVRPGTHRLQWRMHSPNQLRTASGWSRWAPTQMEFHAMQDREP